MLENNKWYFFKSKARGSTIRYTRDEGSDF